MTHEHITENKIIITKPENLEIEINSGAMNRLAGVSELLTGSTGIHMAIATFRQADAPPPTTMSIVNQQFTF